MKNNFFVTFIFLFLIIISMNSSISAHKVNIFAYVEGNMIYTESYFSDGKKCVDSKVEVFNNQGNKLLDGLTDPEGKFAFEVPPESEELKIILTASMGHRAEYIITFDELKNSIDTIKEEIKTSTFLEKEDESSLGECNKLGEIVSPGNSSFDLKEIQIIIEEILDRKLEPIIREIKKSKTDEISLTEILGGIGYIIGIFGILAYFLSRKRREKI